MRLPGVWDALNLLNMLKLLLILVKNPRVSLDIMAVYVELNFDIENASR